MISLSQLATESIRNASQFRFSVPPNARTPSFYATLFVKCSLSLVVICWLLSQFRKSPFESRVGFLSPFDTKAMLDHLLYGLSIFCLIEIGATISFLIPAVIFNTGYLPVFNAPYLATSVRDWWVRWDLPAEHLFRTLTFEPVIKLLNGLKKAKSKPSMVQVTIASFITFLVSGIVHEGVARLASVAMGCRFINAGESLAFFLIQWLLCVIQVVFQKSTGFGRTWGRGFYWNIVGWFVTFMVILVVSPLFIGPFGRCIKPEDFPLPVVF